MPGKLVPKIVQVQRADGKTFQSVRYVSDGAASDATIKTSGSLPLTVPSATATTATAEGARLEAEYLKLSEGGWHSDDRWYSPEWVSEFADHRGYDPDTAAYLANRFIDGMDRDRVQLDTARDKLISEVIAETPEHPKRGDHVVVPTGGDLSVVKIESVRNGKLYGNTVESDPAREFSLDDGVPLSEIRRNA